MILWLLARSVRHAPRRLLLSAVGIAFPVAVLAATLFFVDVSVRSMTEVALQPVQVEMRGLATTLDTNMSKVARTLSTVPGVLRVERFAAADVVVATPRGRATARLFAVDPAYLDRHPWIAHSGSLAGGALLNSRLATTPGIDSARAVVIQLPGKSRPLASVPVRGSVDLRDAFTWFEIPIGDVQGDIAFVPRAIVIDYATFERAVLPALRRSLGPTTAVLNPGLTDLPPVALEEHIAVDHAAYPNDPTRAAAFSETLRRVLERRGNGAIVVADDAYEALTEAAGDATNAKILFLLLGLPGVLAAAALGLATQSALAESQQDEEGLLRLRGATEGQLIRLAAMGSILAGFTGSVLGLAVAAAVVSVVTGHAIWRGTSTASLVLSAALALLAGAVVTLVRLLTLRRAGRRLESGAARQRSRRGWDPLWKRAYLDVAALLVGVTILVINRLSGGLHASLTPGESVALSFYVLLAPIAIWIGLTLLAVRLGLGLLRRRARPEQARPLSTWRGALTRWLGRRPARMAVILTLGILAVSFGTEVVTFVATDQAAKRADVQAAFGSDLRLRPATERPYILPKRLPGVAATTPIHFVPARAGSDRKTALAIDPSSYASATTSSPLMQSGRGLDALVRDSHAVLVDRDLASTLALRIGDTLPVTVFPDDSEKSRKVDLRVAGVFTSFPPDYPPSELVMAKSALPAFLYEQPDFYLARVLPGRSAAAVKTDLRNRGLERAFKVTGLADQARFRPPDLAALNLGPLSTIEALAAALIAAVGVAALGAYLVIERRREFALLRTLGADRSQVVTGPALEGLVIVVGSVVVGIPLGLGLSALAVRVLVLFFRLPPPLLTIPVTTLVLFVLLLIAASGVAIGWALRTVARIAPATLLREP